MNLIDTGSRTVCVSLGERSYGIEIAPGLLDCVGERLLPLLTGRTVLVATHPVLERLYGARLRAALEGSGFRVALAVVPGTERSKSLRQVGRLYAAALAAGLDRKSAVLAFGGGVAGDLAGFVAATFMRGIDFVQVPTTLLAAVDASVGGKVAVDLPGAKNAAGAFHQPRAVFTDTNVLRSLPDRELRAGLAEVIKYGVIRDPHFFAWLETALPSLLGRDAGSLARAIGRSCQIKADVVSRDERDLGLRAILNFGHTVGHAVEAVGGFEAYRHGEAIAVGMVAAARLSEWTGFAEEPITPPVARALRAAGLPVALRAPLPMVALRRAMAADKKTEAGAPHFVLARRLGDVALRPVHDEALLNRVLAALEQEPDV